MNNEMKQIFEYIIRTHYWQEVPCGGGSTIHYTEPLRKALKPFLLTHNINSMLDAPCGDYSWMALTELPHELRYIGADIVEFMIEENRAKYPAVDFRTLDIATDDLPSVDLLFCRDCLFHFSHADIIRTFENFVRSGIPFLMVTCYDVNVDNSDITTGNFRHIDFRSAPYNFPPPIDTINDWIPNTSNGDAKRSLCLWDRNVIQQYLNERK